MVGSGMNRRTLERRLKELGCYVKRNGRHEVWSTPQGHTFPVADIRGAIRHSVISSINKALVASGLEKL